MKRDVNGCSVCQKGEEYFEHFFYRGTRKVEYEYRDYEGYLFIGIFRDVETAQSKRDQWLSDKNKLG